MKYIWSINIKHISTFMKKIYQALIQCFFIFNCIHVNYIYHRTMHVNRVLNQNNTMHLSIYIWILCMVYWIKTLITTNGFINSVPRVQNNLSIVSIVFSCINWTKKYLRIVVIFQARWTTCRSWGRHANHNNTCIAEWYNRMISKMIVFLVILLKIVIFHRVFTLDSLWCLKFNKRGVWSSNYDEKVGLIFFVELFINIITKLKVE